jgi:hypothetical protein
MKHLCDGRNEVGHNWAIAWYVLVHFNVTPTSAPRAARTLPLHRARETHRCASRSVVKLVGMFKVGGGGASRTRKDVVSGITSPGRSA